MDRDSLRAIERSMRSLFPECAAIGYVDLAAAVPLAYRTTVDDPRLADEAELASAALFRELDRLSLQVRCADASQGRLESFVPAPNGRRLRVLFVRDPEDADRAFCIVCNCGTSGPGDTGEAH